MSAHGSNRARVHVEFTRQLKYLARYASYAHYQRHDWALGRWYVPADDPKEVCPLEIAELRDFFSRDQINANYEQVASPMNGLFGTSGDQIALKAQADYVAQVERAYRLRHATWPRLFAHAAARLSGHGHPLGCFGPRAGVAKHVIRTLESNR